MAQGVEVKMTVDSSGTITAIRAAGEEFEQLDEAVTEASQAADRQSQSAEQQASANREAAQAAERNETAQREAAQAAQRYAASTDRMAGAAGSANEVIFSTGDAIQDVQFGMAGAANNIAFVAESFAEVQRQAGGTSAALSGVFAALKGPAGLILGLQALLALGPQIVDFFGSWGDSAEDAADDTKQAERDVMSLAETIRDITEETFQAFEESPEERQRAIAALRQEIERLQRAGSDVSLFGTAEGQRINQQLTAAQNVLEILQNQSQDTREQVEALMQLGLGEDLAQRITDYAQAAEEAEQETTDLASASQLLFDEMRSMMDQPMAETIGGQIPDLGRQLNLPALATDIQDVNDLLEAGMLDSIGAINAALGSLDQILADATSQEKRRRILRLMETLRGMRDEMSSVNQEGIRFGEIIGQGVANAIASMAEAAGSGDNVLQAVGQTLGQLFQRLGKAMIAYGFGLEAVKTLNPAVAIAGGAALVAAGAALSSALSDAQEAIGGGGGGGGAGSPRDFESGGEVGFGVPGRREGGPVAGGQLYETHGLGQREFFVPRSDGAIVTAGAMRAATRRQAQRHTVDVRQQTDVNLDVSEPQLFDLSVALDEVRSFRQDFQQS